MLICSEKDYALAPVYTSRWRQRHWFRLQRIVYCIAYQEKVLILWENIIYSYTLTVCHSWTTFDNSFLHYLQLSSFFLTRFSSHYYKTVICIVSIKFLIMCIWDAIKNLLKPNFIVKRNENKVNKLASIKAYSYFMDVKYAWMLLKMLALWYVNITENDFK